MKNKLAKTMKQIVLLLVLGSLFLCPKSASAGNEADEETLEFDLRDGYLRLVALDSNLGSILDSFRYGGEDSEFFDLDGDGTADIKLSTYYTVYYSYRGILTPVFGGSIHGDFELKPTEEHPFRYTEWDYDAQKEVMHNVSSVVFHFPAEPVKEAPAPAVAGSRCRFDIPHAAALADIEVINRFLTRAIFFVC